MIETLHIHGGSHKTGSSSIQKFLDSNRARLRTLDIHAPKIKRILRPFTDPASCKLALEAFEPLKKFDAKHVIFSREGFSWIDDIDELIGLRDELSSITQNIQVIFYLRRQDSQAISQKQEGTKWKDCSIAYGHDLCALPKTLSTTAYRYLDYKSKFEMWAEVFGQENLIFRIYEAGSLIDGDAVRDFCDIFGINPDDYKLPERINKSFNRTSQLFLHQSRGQFKEGTPEKNLLVQAVRQLNKASKNKEKLLPSRQQAQDFYEQFRDGNKDLNQRFNISSRDTIFSENFSMYPEEVPEQRLGEIQVHQMYAEVLAHLAQNKRSRSGTNHAKLSRQIREIALALPRECHQQSIELLQIAQSVNPKDPITRRKLRDSMKTE